MPVSPRNRGVQKQEVESIDETIDRTVAIAMEATDRDTAIDAMPESSEPIAEVRAEEAAPQESSPIQNGVAVEPCAELPLTQRVEALLLCSDRPLPDSRIASILGLVPESNSGRKATQAVAAVHAAIGELNRIYSETNRSFRIEAVAGGRQILTLSALGPLMARIRAARNDGRLSPAALETLAIIAYRQPILRADIESIRGVACGEVLRTLMDRRLVRIVGRAEELGRPMLYGTTREFLRVFGLACIDELPKTGDSPT